jgi:peptide/nickel transport system substrate-binding protein
MDRRTGSATAAEAATAAVTVAEAAVAAVTRLLRGLGLAASLAAFGAGAFAQDLRIGTSSEPSAMDPHFHNTTPNKAVARIIFEPLVFQDERQQLQPGLAESWRAINDVTWEFTLRKGVTFHDGSPFTADDVVFTFARAPDVPRSPSSFAGFIAGKTVEKLDDHTLLIRTATPQPLTPVDLSTFGIVSVRAAKDAATQDFNSGKAAIGTGPYRLLSFTPGEAVRLERFDGHWREKPHWRSVTLRPIRSDPARVATLLAGGVDVIEQPPTSDLKGLRANGRVTVVSSVSNRVFYLAMDQFREESPFIRGKAGESIRNPFLDRRVRQAVSKAINRQALVERIADGEGQPAGQYMHESFYGTDPKLRPEAFDPSGARTLLADAGYPNGFRLTIHGPNGRYPNDTKIVEAVAQMLTRVGVETSVETLPPANFFSRGSTGGPGQTPEFSMIMAGWGAAGGENSDPLKNLIASFDRLKGLGSSNRGRYANKLFDDRLARALATLDDGARASALAEATAAAVWDAAVIPLYFPLNSWTLRAGLTMTARSDEFTLPWEIRPQ